MLEPMIHDKCGVFGIFNNKEGKLAIHNRIFEQKIYDYMLSKKETATDAYDFNGLQADDNPDTPFDCRLVLTRFQQFMKEHASDRDERFLEREGRLVFLSFLKPIVNGHGFLFKEPVVGKERRMDVVVTYGTDRRIFELKIWYGDAWHQKGLQQLSDYLDLYDQKKGFLLIFDFNKSKQYRQETIRHGDKTVFAVWV